MLQRVEDEARVQKADRPGFESLLGHLLPRGRTTYSPLKPQLIYDLGVIVSTESLAGKIRE